MKIVFFGTSEFAVPALRALCGAKYEIAAVVTQPDKPAGRKQEPLPSPVKLAALELGLKVFQPHHLSSPPQAWGGQGEVDLYIVASYGKIIPKAVLDLPKFGTLNIHPSLLPKYRGPSPIQAAILNGDTETGVTIIKLDSEMDHGDIISNVKFQMSNDRIGYRELHDKLAGLGAELLIKILPDYVDGKITPKPQDHKKATFTKIIKKDDARIDWEKPAQEIDAMARAYSNWPVAWTMLDGKRLKIYETALPLPEGRGRFRGGKAGEVEIAGKKLLVHCGRGALEITTLQLEGSRMMPAADFINRNSAPPDFFN